MRLARPLLLSASVALLACGVLASPGEEPSIHECRDAHGNVLYQDEPCPEVPGGSTAASTPSKTPAPAARPALPPPERPHAEAARGTMPFRSPGRSPRTTSGPLASPEKTWRTFVAAIESGDGAAAAACLTSSALAGLGADVEPLRLDELRATVGAFTRIQVDGEIGPFWSIHARRPHRPPKWIFFERTARGEWKIAAI